ncbi:MAG: hypothetical protein V3V47_02770, partial [Desulfobacteria bacterium]
MASLRAMIQRNEADIPKMVTEQGKRLDGEAMFLNKLLRHNTTYPCVISLTFSAASAMLSATTKSRPDWPRI